MSTERIYTVYCGNHACRSRTELQANGMVGRLFAVADSDLVDGEAWLCVKCAGQQSLTDAS